MTFEELKVKPEWDEDDEGWIIAEIERKNKALEFYANKKIYQINRVDFSYSHHRHNDPLFYREILNDKGKIAREALKEG